MRLEKNYLKSRNGIEIFGVEDIALSLGQTPIRDFRDLLRDFLFPVSRQTAYSEQIKRKFEKLRDQWRSETCLLSSIHEASKHSAYQEIIRMGEEVIPLLLSELKIRPDHWLVALTEITHESPIHPEHRGNLKKMTEDWLAWARSKGYLSE